MKIIKNKRYRVLDHHGDIVMEHNYLREVKAFVKQYNQSRPDAVPTLSAIKSGDRKAKYLALKNLSSDMKELLQKKPYRVYVNDWQKLVNRGKMLGVQISAPHCIKNFII